MTLALAGCGQFKASRTPAQSALPMVPGARIVTQVRQCDRGANAYCALEFVVVDPRYHDATALLSSERDHLRQHGWTSVNGDFGQENGADSPGHELRLTYGTAQYDLQGIDLGWIKRSWKVASSLSNAVFDRAPAISLMLETGSS
jgi:hypothetical protein